MRTAVRRQTGAGTRGTTLATETATNPVDAAIEEALAGYDDDADEPAAPAVTDEDAPNPDDVNDDADDVADEDSDDDDVDDSGEVDDNDDDTDEDSDDESGNTEAVDVDEEATYRLSDGTEVTGADLRGGYMRQADYTRKTQEVAKRRKEVEDLYGRMEQWYQDRSSNPSGWVREIADGTDDPDGVMVEAIGSADKPTVSLAKVIRGLAEGGKLDKEFVDHFGLQEVAAKADEATGDDRVARLEQKIEQDRETREAQERQQQVLSELEGQWRSIVDSEGLTFEGSEAETQTKVELMRFARDNEIPNLQTAWAAMQYQQGQPRGGKQQKSETDDSKANGSKAKAKDTVDRKRRTRSMGRSRSAKAPQPPRPKGDLDAAINESLSELGFGE